jgi:SpoVK/Ycf46/Vps4 family AAA+-type ATPase
VECEKDITIYEFALPTTQEIEALATKIVAENNLDITIDSHDMAAAKGLTIEEAENAITLSIVQSGSLSRSVLEHEKLQAVKKSGLMEIYKAVDESEIGGLEELKKYLHNRKKGFAIANNKAAPKGILLVGLPGGGKTLSAKAAASILGMPLVRLDISSLKGSLVGESEQKMRAATKVIDAISPCVVLLDELDKALSGVQSSGKTDGGTTSGMFGYFLNWMQESLTPKFIIGTVNDLDDLLSISQGALIRRFDDIWMVDLPSREERVKILEIMNRRYGTDFKPELVDRMDNFTGAEIEKTVIASLYDGIDVAMANVHPIYQQNRAKIDAAREWAKDNARCANGNDTVAVAPKKMRRVR